VLPIVVLVAAWQVWDNVETRRLQRAIAQFGPDTRPPAPGALLLVSQQRGEDDDAARLYAAAAIVSVNRAASAVPSRSVLDVIRRRRDGLVAGVAPSADDAEQWSRIRAQATLPAMLIEQAGPLSFTSFVPGTEFNYRASGLINASRLSAAVTLAAIDPIDTDAAFRSLLSRIRFLRALDAGLFVQDQRARLGQDVATDLSLVMGRARLSDAQLQALDDAWAPLYRDDELPRSVNALAYSQLDFFNASGGRPFWNGVVWGALSPWMRGRASRHLESVAEALRVSKQRWPERLRGLAQVKDATPSFSVRVITHNLGIGIASFAATVRTTRTALAAERYRRANGRLPGSLGELARPSGDIEDPFSGESIKFVVAADGFAVYSVGPDGRDDGGRLEAERAKGRSPGSGPLLDIGVRVSYRRAASTSPSNSVRNSPVR
jgi:hypothetical protein